MSKLFRYSFLAAALLASGLSHAYETRTGLVKKITVNAPAISNRSVIVEIDGVNPLCSSIASAQGYFNKADLPDTFSSFVSTLLTAQATGRSVTVFVIPGAEGCRIDQVQLNY